MKNKITKELNKCRFKIEKNNIKSDKLYKEICKKLKTKDNTGIIFDYVYGNVSKIIKSDDKIVWDIENL